MKIVQLVSAFGLLFLVGCGGANIEQSDLAQKNGTAPTGELVDSMGCDSSRTPLGGGSGKIDDPFLVCSVPHLEAMASTSAPGYYLLTRDLDLTNEKHEFLGLAITGVFDGANHSIKNFSISLGMGQENGFLFGQLFSTNHLVAEIKNLKLEDFNIVTDSAGGTSALIGTNNGGKISNVHVTGRISGKNMVGGIVANNFGIIENSSFSGIIYGKTEIGGIAGRTTDHFIRNCRASGQVTGQTSVGGIVGDSDIKAELTNNTVDANIIGSSDFGTIYGTKKRSG